MPHTILICDDEAVLRELVRAALADAYSILEAADGEAAVTLARQIRPDLIILDMMMPGRSGLDVLRELRSDPVLAPTPVLMLSARAQATDREAAAAAGADRYLAKPFSPVELAASVRQMLRDGR